MSILTSYVYRSFATRSTSGSSLSSFAFLLPCDDGTRALVLSEVDGIEPFNQSPPYLSPDEFQRRVEAAFAELCPMGLAHSDLKLDNCLLVEDGLVILDLESVTEENPDNVEFINQSHARELRRRYEDLLDGLARFGECSLRVPFSPCIHSAYANHRSGVSGRDQVPGPPTTNIFPR